MKRLSLILLAAICFLSAACQSSVNGVTEFSFRNPILPGFHPDPSICRVGEDYYIVNSTFQYFPGVPVYHSRDLFHWELIGNVLDRETQLPLEKTTADKGIYATTIRYNEGVFYMITTNVTLGRNFYVTATDPAGPWSEPIWLEQGGIDPSFYFEDGKCYYVSNPDATITLCEIDPATGEQLTESRPIWKGMGGRFPEGPHIYKVKGWYYLLISEGGTELAHSLTVARSRSPYGPYEACPKNPILTHCRHETETDQIQGTGHGDFVQAPDGSWWVVFLAYRNFGGNYHHLGRETFLAPVRWEKGWPVVNDGKPITQEMGGSVPRRTSEYTESFERPLGPDWLYIQNPDSSRYDSGNGRLILQGSGSLSGNDHPTFVACRQESEVASVETEVLLLTDGEAGLTIYQTHEAHVELAVRRNGNKAEAVVRNKVLSIDYTAATLPLSHPTAHLKITSDGLHYHFLVSEDGQDWKPMGQFRCALLSTEVAGGFTGVTMGLYAEGAKAAFTYYSKKEK